MATDITINTIALFKSLQPTMDMMRGKDTRSCTAIPCIMQNTYGVNVQYILNVYGNITITNNNVGIAPHTKETEQNGITEEVRDTKKRKRVPSDIRPILISECKFKRLKEMKNVDESRYVVIKSNRIENPIPNEMQKCKACNETYNLSAFNKCFNKKDGSSYHYIKNVCRSCINKQEKTERKKRSCNTK